MDLVPRDPLVVPVYAVAPLAVANQLKTRQQSVVGTLAIIAGLWIFVKVIIAGIAAAFLT